MYGPYPSNPEEAIALLMGEEPDTPRDCHNHCACWDTSGECCECGDIRTPNHNYSIPAKFEEEELEAPQ